MVDASGDGHPTATPTALVLGSGGARGLAHIGVIHCLEERGYDIRYIAGFSIGALVGGIYAAGKLDVYAEWVGALEPRAISYNRAFPEGCRGEAE